MTTGTTLVLLGVACIIAAIVGGGFKLARTEFPTITSVRRQFLLALFGLILILGGWAMDTSSRGKPQKEIADGPASQNEQAAPTVGPSTPQESRTVTSSETSEPRDLPVTEVPGTLPEGDSAPVRTTHVEARPVPPVAPPQPACEPLVIGHPGFSLLRLASGGYRLAAPANQCPAAGIGETLVVEIELCSGRPSPFSTLAPDFQAYDRNGSRIRSQAELGVATAGPDRRYGYETLSGRQNPRFATGAAYAKLAVHGRGPRREVAPQLCGVEIQ
ncbi:MAG TPA: hypothetical protein VGW34_06590 [Allosphingosinicella sp.]|nr:hypothetical protein [Allosphingosinicella sp.]